MKTQDHTILTNMKNEDVCVRYVSARVQPMLSYRTDSSSSWTRAWTHGTWTRGRLWMRDACRDAAPVLAWRCCAAPQTSMPETKSMVHKYEKIMLDEHITNLYAPR